ncbi:MAG: acetylxylan esterase [Planctomycetales bacterium]|nr:acetylxylan esterase [Planctomycetales bacterium]
MIRSVCLCLSLLATVGAATADDFNVLGDGATTLLYDALRLRADEQFAARQQQLVADLQSPELIEARRQRLQDDYATMLGTLPERTPLEPVVVDTIPCDGYRIEKVMYQSRPHHHVTANLYLPDDVTGPIPGVLVPCGHSDNGKASEAYQSVCILLVKNGIAALIYDPIGQGERHQMVDIDSHGTNEHILVGVGALAVGWNTATFRVWDGIRSLDYLASRPEVDPQRLGCTGNSGGGTMTTWLMAADPRIAVAAPSCFITSLSRLFATIGPQDAEQHFPAQGAFGIDHTDFITMRSPKPTIILAAEEDFFDIGGTRQAFIEARAVYGTLGHADRVGFFSFPDGHGFSQPRREAAVAWMRRWLAGDNRRISEAEPTLQSDVALQVSPSGQVMRDFDDEVTVTDVVVAEAHRLAAARANQPQQRDLSALRGEVSKRLGIDTMAPAKLAETLGPPIDRDGYSIERLRLERDGGIPLPALLFVPTGAEGPRGATLVVDSDGKSATAADDGICAQLAREGRLVLSIDAAGWGETGSQQHAGRVYNDTYRAAMLAVHVGDPLLAWRTRDVLAALAWLVGRDEVAHDDVADKSVAEDSVAEADIALIGINRGGPVALHAAVLATGNAEAVNTRVETVDSITSWEADVVATPAGENLIELVVPGALEAYDLPDLVRLLGERSTSR